MHAADYLHVAQLSRVLAVLVASGIMPIISLLDIFSPRWLAAFRKFPYFGHLRHLTLESLYHLEAKITKKTVQLLFEAAAACSPMESEVSTRSRVHLLNLILQQA